MIYATTLIPFLLSCGELPCGPAAEYPGVSLSVCVCAPAFCGDTIFLWLPGTGCTPVPPKMLVGEQGTL